MDCCLALLCLCPCQISNHAANPHFFNLVHSVVAVSSQPYQMKKMQPVWILGNELGVKLLQLFVYMDYNPPGHVCSADVVSFHSSACWETSCSSGPFRLKVSRCQCGLGLLITKQYEVQFLNVGLISLLFVLLCCGCVCSTDLTLTLTYTAVR